MSFSCIVLFLGIINCHKKCEIKFTHEQLLCHKIYRYVISASSYLLTIGEVHLMCKGKIAACVSVKQVYTAKLAGLLLINLSMVGIIPPNLLSASKLHNPRRVFTVPLLSHQRMPFSTWQLWINNNTCQNKMFNWAAASWDYIQTGDEFTSVKYCLECLVKSKHGWVSCKQNHLWSAVHDVLMLHLQKEQPER